MSLWTEKRCAARDVFLRASSVMLLLFRWPFLACGRRIFYARKSRFDVSGTAAPTSRKIFRCCAKICGFFFSCTLSARASRFEEHIRSLCL